MAAVAVSGPIVAAELTTPGEVPTRTAAANAGTSPTPKRRAIAKHTNMKAASQKAPNARPRPKSDKPVSFATGRVARAVTA